MFRNSAGGDIEEFTEAVVGFIGKIVDDTTPRKTIRTFPNQKPWVDKSIRDALRSRTAAYNSGLATGNMDEYKAASYAVRRAVRDAKRRYGQRLEQQLDQSDPRGLWQGLRNITDYKTTRSHPASADSLMADELNNFFARFESANRLPAVIPARGEETLAMSERDVRREFKRVNSGKAAGPDGISGRVLKACADQLAPVFTDIFNLSLKQCVIPTCFKKSVIVPVPKTPHPSSPNDYRPIALTSVVMKCFEKIIKTFITSTLPPTLDPLQFAYRTNRSANDAIALLLHKTLSHVDTGKGNYVRILFVDYSSAFNTIVPSRLVSKLHDLGLDSSLCRWVYSFLTGRPQVVRLGHHTSSPLTLNIGSPQGCVLSPLLYSLYTHDCEATSDSTIIVKFADDTAVMGLISHDDETAYRREVSHLEDWCRENHLLLNVSKTKELIVDFSRKRQRDPHPFLISGSEVERVDTFKYLGVTISQDLCWTSHINATVKKARQRLFFLRRLRDFRLPLKVLRNFYTCTIESILCGSMTTWMGNCTKQDFMALKRVVRSAERTIRTTLPNLQDIYKKRCRTRALKILRDPSHPGHSLFSPLPSGRRLRCLKTKTERMKKSFFPQAIQPLNEL